jgi:hypothetical protein
MMKDGSVRPADLIVLVTGYEGQPGLPAPRRASANGNQAPPCVLTAAACRRTLHARQEEGSDASGCVLKRAKACHKKFRADGPPLQPGRRGTASP